MKISRFFGRGGRGRIENLSTHIFAAGSWKFAAVSLFVKISVFIP